MTTNTKPTKRAHSTNRLSPCYRAVVPLGTDGALACSICGDFTAEAEQRGVELVEALGFAPRTLREKVSADMRGGALGQPFATKMTRCPHCSNNRDLAEHLVARYPGTAQTGDLVFYGSAAVDAVEFVLAAVDGADIEIPIQSRRDMRLACKHLLDIGRMITWAARFAGIADRDARPDTAAAVPWAHLSKESLAETRRARIDYLKARNERPTQVKPSEALACYLCGIGEVTARPSQAANQWHFVKILPESFGGRYGAERVDAEVCAMCFNEYREVGVWGATLLDRLVLRTAGVLGHPGAQDVHLNGVRAWGSSRRTKPNATRFAHLNLGKLAEDIRTGVIE